MMLLKGVNAAWSLEQPRTTRIPIVEQAQAAQHRVMRVNPKKEGWLPSHSPAHSSPPHILHSDHSSAPRLAGHAPSARQQSSDSAHRCQFLTRHSQKRQIVHVCTLILLRQQHTHTCVDVSVTVALLLRLLLAFPQLFIAINASSIAPHRDICFGALNLFNNFIQQWGPM